LRTYNNVIFAAGAAEFCFSIGCRPIAYLRLVTVALAQAQQLFWSDTDNLQWDLLYNYNAVYNTDAVNTVKGQNHT